MQFVVKVVDDKRHFIRKLWKQNKSFGLAYVLGGLALGTFSFLPLHLPIFRCGGGRKCEIRDL